MEISALVGQRRAEIDYARGAGVSLSLDSLHDVFKAIKKPKKKPARNVIDLRQEYRKLAKKAGGKAVAKISESLLGRVNTLIDDGALLKTARREIRKTLQSAGAYGADDYLLNTLFRTHSQIATQGAYWQELEDHPTLWGYLYSTADDERVRPGHALLDGTTLPIGHKLWRKIAPPNGYNCRCYVIPLFDAEPVVKPKKGWSVDPGFETNWGTMFARISQAA